MNKLMRDYIEEQLIEYEKVHLEEKNYDYRMLVQEYREGILLFDIMNQEVWNKALIDTIGLEQYYQNNIDNYQWDERLDAIIFSSEKMQDIEMIRNMLNLSYYQIYESQLSYDIPIDNEILDIMTSTIDSLISFIYSDTTKWLEISCDKIGEDKMFEHITSSNLNSDRIIFKEMEENILNVKVLSNSKKSIEKIINKNSALTLQVESGLYEKGDNEIIDLIEWESGIFDLSIENVEHLVYVEGIVPSKSKKLKEIKGQVISDYQNFLEKEWIEKLKRKFNVEINNNALSKVYKYFKAN
jgi:peptidyl-prolyl cis-trans isomerase SurA